MVTREQALTARYFHYTGKHECDYSIGPRGAEKLNITSCKRIGKTKTWKTRPDDFCVSVRYGLRNYGSITPINAQHWHVPEECPALREYYEREI